MVDLSFLEKFTNGDRTKMKRYINLYLDVAPKTLKTMQQCLEDKDWGQLRIHAHSLKPQADFMGVSELKKTLIKIEEAIKTNEIYQIKKYVKLAIDISDNSFIILKDIVK